MKDAKDKRRIPIEENWFHKNVNDIIYGFMLSMATRIPEGKNVWDVRLNKKEFKRQIKYLRSLLEITDNRTLKNKILAIQEQGYITEDEEFYYFSHFDGYYYIINNDMLSYLSKTFSSPALKIYIYLAFRNNAIKNYNFSINELKQKFGYSKDTHSGIVETISYQISSLKKCGILNYRIDYKIINNIPIPHYVLLDIATDVPTDIKKERVH